MLDYKKTEDMERMKAEAVKRLKWLKIPELDEAFAKGLKAYFEKHQYNNTVGRDLWNCDGFRRNEWRCKTQELNYLRKMYGDKF